MTKSGQATESGAEPATDPAGLNNAALSELLAPLCELALTQGVKLQSLIDLVKLGLVDAALDLNKSGPSEPNLSDSQLAVMTGVHRKDLRALRIAGAARPARKQNLAAEVFARWLSDPAYLTRKGQPRILPRQTPSRNETSGPSETSRPGEPSFERLVAGVSTDVHPRSVLDELLRLRLVHWTPPDALGSDKRGQPDTVRILSSSFTPSADRQAHLQFLAANARAGTPSRC